MSDTHKIGFRSYGKTMELIVYDSSEDSPECTVIGLTPTQAIHLVAQIMPAIRDRIQLSGLKDG